LRVLHGPRLEYPVHRLPFKFMFVAWLLCLITTEGLPFGQVVWSVSDVRERHKVVIESSITMAFDCLQITYFSASNVAGLAFLFMRFHNLIGRDVEGNNDIDGLIIFDSSLS
jgi:hypothetical protein